MKAAGRTIRSHWIFIVAILISTLILSYQLDRNLFQEWDECVYAQYAREMKHSGNFLYYTWNGERLFEKPPLYGILLQIPFFFGIEEGNARLLSVFTTIATSVVIYIFGLQFFTRRTALFASFLLLTSQYYILHTRTVATDILFSLFILLGTLFLTKSTKVPRYVYLSGLFFGLALMQKGVSVFAYQAAVYMALLLMPNRRKTLGLITLNVLTMLAVVAPWHIYMIHSFGLPFIREYLIENALMRTTATIGLDYPFYVLGYYIVRDFFPWILASVLFLRDTRWRSHTPGQVIVWGAVVPLILFSSFKTRHLNYTVPVYPFIALMLGYSLDQLIARIPPRRVASGVYTAAVSLVIVHVIYINTSMVAKFLAKGPTTPRHSIFVAAGTMPYSDLHYLIAEPYRNLDELYKDKPLVPLLTRYGPTPCVRYYSDKKLHLYYSPEDFVESMPGTNSMYLIDNSDKSLLQNKQVNILKSNSEYTLFTGHAP